MIVKCSLIGTKIDVKVKIARKLLRNKNRLSKMTGGGRKEKKKKTHQNPNPASVWGNIRLWQKPLAGSLRPLVHSLATGLMTYFLSFVSFPENQLWLWKSVIPAEPSGHSKCVKAHTFSSSDYGRFCTTWTITWVRFHLECLEGPADVQT